jgi:hypothetical protein
MKQLLVESYKTTKKMTGLDPSKPGNIRGILSDDQAFDAYARSLMEGISDPGQCKDFLMLAQNTRKTLLENSMYQLNPYETLALPLLRVFFPKTIAKELVTVIPMDKPEIVRGFVRATFKRWNDTTEYAAPSNTDVSNGPSVTVPLASAVNLSSGGATFNVLTEAGLTADSAHVQKDFIITGVVDATSEATVSITPTVDGEFSADVTTYAGATDTITGRIDYYTGKVDIASVTGAVTGITYTASISLEENVINPRVKFAIDKLRLYAKDRQISTEWTVQMEQDIKALFNVDIQAELVSVIGQQIVLDIDREIVNSLIFACERLAGSNHSATFDKTPPSTFSWGPKMWMENVLPTLNELSARIYTDTNMAAGNVLACNPLDATIFESLQEFRYTGKSDVDGDLGYESATVANGKWRILVSSVVPQGKVLNVYKPVEEIRAVYIFAPYVPAVLSPYPLGPIPSLTVLSRYGTQLIRPQGISVLNVTAS